MDAFITQLAEQLVRRYSEKMNEVCVVLPNRRARVFLKDALQQAIDKPIWMPEVFGMEDFMTRLSGKTIPSSFNLLFELFQVWKASGNMGMGVDEFFQRGKVMLADFNEIDLYMVDVDLLFENLSDLKAMEKWHPGEHLSDMERSYLAFFASLRHYYHRLNERLEAKNEAYRGAIFRYVAAHMETLSSSLPWSQVVFAGFNALSVSEKRVISTLVEQEKALLFFDTDAYYMEDDRQEAGHFLRGLKSEFARNKPPFYWTSEGFKQEKEIHVVKAAGAITMAKMVTPILASIPDHEKTRDTAIVLVDEDLLIPVISAIPYGEQKFNVTMGYAFRHSAAAELIVLLLDLYVNAEQNRLQGRSDTYFYHYLEKVLKHPYVKYAKGFSEKGLAALVAHIEAKNRVLYDLEGLFEVTKTWGVDLSLLPGKLPKDPGGVVERLRELFTAIHDRLYEQGLESALQRFDYEFVCQAILFLNKLAELIGTYRDVENMRILKVIATQMMQEVVIPFVGEPLSGLQVMGMLETRTLDFKNVIMLSVNEGSLPRAKSYHSLVPHSLRKRFGLPSYTEKNALFAYHFYRLLQRAENVWLLYDTQSFSMGKGEPSRFLMQIKEELPRYNPKIQLDVWEVQDRETPKPGKGLAELEKTPEVIALLQTYLSEGISPTAFNAYRESPLQFFLTKVLGAEELEEVEETVDARIFGNVIHRTLEKLYEPYLNRVLLPKDCEQIQENLETALLSAFEEKYGGDNMEEGFNLLARNAARSYLLRMIAHEKRRVSEGEVVVKALEKLLAVERIIAMDDGREVKVVFKGFADRIEQWNGRPFIVDYKTGRVGTLSLSAVLKETPPAWDKVKAIDFQLLMYSWLYHEIYHPSEMPLSGAWALRYGEKPIQSLEIKDDISWKALMASFGAFLEELVREILNTNLPLRFEKDKRE